MFFFIWNVSCDIFGCVCARLYVFGGYGPDVDEYLHGVGDFFWDTVSCHFTMLLIDFLLVCHSTSVDLQQMFCIASC